MTRVNLNDNQLSDPCIKRGLRLAKTSWAPLTGAAMSDQMTPYVELNPAGAVTILMPTSTPARTGLMFLLSNISAATVTVNTDTNVAFTTAIALTTGQSCWVICTGSTTPALGWRKIPTTAA
jgi:hypothetical protein